MERLHISLKGEWAVGLGGVLNTSVLEILPTPANLRRDSDLDMEWDEGDKLIFFFLLLREVWVIQRRTEGFPGTTWQYGKKQYFCHLTNNKFFFCNCHNNHSFSGHLLQINNLRCGQIYVKRFLC